MRKRRKLGRGGRREGETRGDEGPSQTTISGREKKNPRLLEGYLNCRESSHCVPNENRSGPAVVYKRPCSTDVTVQPPLFQGSIPSSTKYGFIVSRHGLDISQWEQAVPPAPATQTLENQPEEISSKLAEMDNSCPDTRSVSNQSVGKSKATSFLLKTCL